MILVVLWRKQEEESTLQMWLSRRADLFLSTLAGRYEKII
jgi:hypothetical protein